MKDTERKGKAQTVLGLIDGNDLGFTLPHEHFFCDSRSYYFMEPADPYEKELAYQPVTLENLGWVRSHRYSSLDNLLIDDEETAIREVMRFKQAGGNTITDVTPNHVGRNPSGFVSIAKATGINVIMGTSYYMEQTYRPEMNMSSRSEEDIAGEFVRDIMTGVGNTGICAGIIGEIGCSCPLTKNERKVLRAAVMAQQETSAAISIHLPPSEDGPFEILEVLTNAGADLSRVIMGHATRGFSISASSNRRKIAETGCYLEYDMFGHDGSLPVMTPYDMANDVTRINQIIELIAYGYLSQILISHDVFLKIDLSCYGGWGYNHILKTVIPIMKRKGMSEEQIRAITVENPKRILTFT